MLTFWNDVKELEYKQYYVVADNVRTRVLETGNGEPLILLHGTSGTLECFSRNLVELSKHFTVYCIDMLGHGFTEKPDMPYTIDKYSDHLLGVVNVLGLKKVFLNGESLGGWVAGWFAAHHPDRVIASILTTPGDVTNSPDRLNRTRESTMTAVRNPSIENVKYRLELLMFDKNDVTPELIEIRRQVYSQPGFERTAENILVLQDFETRIKYAFNENWCSRIKTPTLILMTDHDPTASIEEMKVVQKMIPNCEMKVIYDAGHWPMWEKPEEFNQITIEYFSNYK